MNKYESEDGPGLNEPESAEVAPAEAGSSSGQGLRELGWGLELGNWVFSLISIPVAGLLVGGSTALLPYTGASGDALYGLAAFVLRWAGSCLLWGALFAVPAGLVVWLYRGLAARIGRPRPEPSARRRRRRWAVVAGLGLVGFGAGVAGGSYLIRESFRSLENATAETDAIDPNWRLDDLMATREEVTDEENGALVAAAAAASLPWGWPPEASEDDPSGYDLRPVWDRMNNAVPFRRLDDETADILRAELEIHDEAVELARSLVDYEHGRHEYDLKPILIDTPLPETQETRHVARLLQTDATIAAQDGRFDEASVSCRAILGTARSIGDEPFLAGQLMSVAIDFTAVKTACRILAQGEPPEEALAALQAVTSDERGRARIKDGLRGERAVVVEMIRRIGSGEMTISDLSGSESTKAIGEAAPISGLLIVVSPYQQSVALRWCNELLSILDRPESEWLEAAKAWERKVEAVRKSRFGLFTATVPLMLMPSVSVGITLELRLRAELGSLVVLIAAERHRRRHGVWPGSIDAIDSDILPDPPLDPYGGGESFRIKYADGVFRVYSIGPNGRDEQGSYEPKTWARGETDDDIGVAGYDLELRGSPPADDLESEEETMEDEDDSSSPLILEP